MPPVHVWHLDVQLGYSKTVEPAHDERKAYIGGKHVHSEWR